MPSHLPMDVGSEVVPIYVDKSFRYASDPETWNAFQKVAEDILKYYDVKRFKKIEYKNDSNDKILHVHFRDISFSYRNMYALNYSGNDRTHAFVESEKKFTILVDIDGADTKSTKIMVNTNTVEVIAKWETEAKDHYYEILYSKRFSETPQNVSAQITSDGILMVTIPNEASTLKVLLNLPVQSPTKKTVLLERVLRAECYTDIQIIPKTDFCGEPSLEHLRYFFQVVFINFLIKKGSPCLMKDQDLFLEVRKAKVTSDYIQTSDSFYHTILICPNVGYENYIQVTVEENRVIMLHCNTFETSDLIRNCRVSKKLILDADANLKAATSYLFEEHFLFIYAPRMTVISSEDPKSVVQQVLNIEPRSRATAFSSEEVSLFGHHNYAEAKRCFECVAQLAANYSYNINGDYGMSLLDRNILVHVSNIPPRFQIIVDAHGYQVNNLTLIRVAGTDGKLIGLRVEGLREIYGKVSSKHQLRITFLKLPLFLDIYKASANFSVEGLIRVIVPRHENAKTQEKYPLLISLLNQPLPANEGTEDFLLLNATAGNLRDLDLIKMFKIHSNISNAAAGGHFYIDKDFEQFRPLFQYALRCTYRRFEKCSAFQDNIDFYKCLRLQRQSAYGSNVAINKDVGDHVKIIFDAMSVVQGLSIQVLDANRIKISGSYKMEANDYQLMKYHCYINIHTYFCKIFNLPDGFNPFKAICRISSDRVVCIAVPKS